MFDRTADRAVSPVVGTVLLVLVTLLVVAVAGSSVLGMTEDVPATRAPAALSVEADGGGRIAVTHDGGAPIDLASASVRVTVDGDPLAVQPPVPFFSTAGFEPGPTGPFNSASDPRWSVGETGSFTVAGTNDPDLTVGSTVVVEVIEDERVIASAETSVVGDAADGDEG
ncbi:MAG: type IV pilin [Halanaeroarchaeum sp.]